MNLLPIQPVRKIALAFEVIPPRSEDGIQEVVGLETVMQSLVLSVRQPIALEIGGEPTRKRFLVRATTRSALAHAEHQLRLRYPQADIQPLTVADDPLRLAPDETVTVAELCPGAAQYLPMREWSPQILQQQKGIDPLLGVLAALSTLPEDHRAVAQIALVPTSPTWSKPHQRKAIEHALEPERIARQEHLAQTRTTDGGPSMAGLVLLGLILASFFLRQHFRQAIPSWLSESVLDLLFHGQLPPLTGEQRFQFFGGIGILLVTVIALTVAFAWLKRLFERPVYDQHLVAERTARMAYRGRIRLYVLGPTVEREQRVLRKEQEQARRAALDSLVAAYRQFHTADAGHFVPRILSPRKGEQLLSLRAKGAPIWWITARIQTTLIAPLYRKATRSIGPHLASVTPFVRQGLKLIWSVWSHMAPVLPLQNAPLPGWACGIQKSRHFFTGDFLSSAWRLPGRADLGELSGIAQKRARTLPLPQALLTAHQSHVTCLGECSHSGLTHPFLIPSGFFDNHTFLGGKSGEGKSTLMVHLAKAVIGEERRGLFLLDPHGDLAEDVLRAVPPHRHDDVVLIDLGNADFCVGLNPLDVTLGRERDLVVSSLISVFSHIWQTTWGPRMEAPFRAAILTLFEANEQMVRKDSLHGPDQQYTLLDVMQVLVDESFCHDLLGHTPDLFLQRFWYEYYSPLSLVQQRDRIDPVLTKMMQFESKIARRILGQSRSTIRLHELVQQRKLLIVRLAFSEAGAQTGSLIGATLLGLLMVTLREQSRVSVQERARMVMFLDEFQTFGGGADLSQLLAELRKYGGSAVMATQSLEYLTTIDPVLLPTVQANTKQYFLFRLSATDAASIAPELDIAPADLVNLDTHTCYVRLVYGGQQQPTFSLNLHLPWLFSEEHLPILREHSLRTYCRPAVDIEQHLVEALGRAIAASMSQQQKANSANTAKEGEAAHSPPGDSDGTPTATNTSPEDPSRRIQFPAKPKKRKKGQVTSYDRHPYDPQATQTGNTAEEEETTEDDETTEQEEDLQ